VLAAAAAGSAIGWPSAAAAKKNTELSALVLSSDIHASTGPQRLAFTIARGPKFAAGPPARIAFLPPGTGKRSKDEVPVFDTTLHKAGLPKGRGLYVIDGTFPEAGTWDAVVLTRGKQVPFAFTVKDAPEAPPVGAPAPRAPSPTTADRLGVKPICTRRPQCPLHDVSLSELIGTGMPVAAMFATPALCVSRYCGPVLDELLDVMGSYENRIRFVHIEIYKSNRGVKRSPTVDAWNLPSEPWLFTIDGTGVINARLDGAFGGDEIAHALDALVA
jgi:hypothetical protein